MLRLAELIMGQDKVGKESKILSVRSTDEYDCKRLRCKEGLQ